MFVLVERLDEDARGVLTKNTLQTDVELRLRQAAIRVLTEVDWKRDPRSPMLYLNVNLRQSSNLPALFVYNVYLSLNQSVHLMNGQVMLQATIWSHSAVSLAGRDYLAEGVRVHVRDLVDAFINAYLAVNPKR